MPEKRQIATNREKKESDHIRVARMTMWQTIVITLITACAGIIGGYLTGKSERTPIVGKSEENFKNVVPTSKTINVKTLPEDINNDDYILIKDISIFDLRGWKYTPDSLKNSKHSATNYTNYLHVRKLKPIKTLTAHYSTSGLQIDMQCITQPAAIYRKKDDANKFHKGEQEYAIQIDVSKMEIGKEFLVVIEATFWNAFNDTNHSETETYTEKEVTDMEELGLIVFFPDDKPFKNTSFWSIPQETEIESQYISSSTIFPDLNKKFIYWSIKERLPNNHYKLKWDW